MKLKFLPFLLLALVLLPTAVVYAAPLFQIPSPDSIVTLLQAALTVVLGLVGYPAAIAAASVIALKLGASPQFVADATGILNILVFAGVAYLLATGQGALVQVIDSSLSGFAKLLTDLVVVLGGFAAARVQTSSYVRKFVAHTAAFHDAARALRG